MNPFESRAANQALDVGHTERRTGAFAFLQGFPMPVQLVGLLPNAAKPTMQAYSTAPGQASKVNAFMHGRGFILDTQDKKQGSLAWTHSNQKRTASVMYLIKQGVLIATVTDEA